MESSAEAYALSRRNRYSDPSNTYGTAQDTPDKVQ